MKDRLDLVCKDYGALVLIGGPLASVVEFFRQHALAPTDAAADLLEALARVRLPWHPQFLAGWGGALRGYAEAIFNLGPFRFDRWGAGVLALTLLLLDAFPLALFSGYAPTEPVLRWARVTAGAALVSAVPIAATFVFGLVALVIALFATIVVVVVELLIFAFYGAVMVLLVWVIFFRDDRRLRT